jgi:hypothetical protein
MVGYFLETWVGGMRFMAKSFKYRTTTSRFRPFSLNANNSSIPSILLVDDSICPS